MDKTANCIDATSLQTMSSSTLFTPSSEVDKGAKKRESRVRFDDEEASQHEQPHPKTSPHWQSLSHDLENDKYWEKIEDLEDQLRLDLSLEQSSSNKKKGFLVALWSCIAGYCEALSTSKQPQRRYPIFPVPISALERLVREEYISNMLDSLGGLSIDIDDVAKDHRERVRRISNSIWQKAIPKPNVRDELHANSLYTCLRGSIERKSLDCFGSAICVISALWILEESSSSSKSSTMTTASSQLALSEDHAYEMHRITTTTNSGEQGTCIVGTCEIAIPGNTKLAQSKRGRDISETYKNSPTMTPECSWLYMAKNPVICNSLSMVLVAVFGNLNPTIEKKSSTTLSSGQLYDFKRDLLWVLHDQEAMKNFPFGLMELGDCEEHRGSKRSEEWVTIPEIPEPILMNEKLFWDAIEVNQRMYNESQTYPYFYAGHYHKDAGKSGSSDQEYRLVESMRLYARAIYVTSQYRYEGVDSLQLNKHTTACAQLIVEDIILDDEKRPRAWGCESNAIAFCTWLAAFVDSLLYWEEQSSHSRFVEILAPSHKFFVGKMLQYIPQTIRQQAMGIVLGLSKSQDKVDKDVTVACTPESLLYFDDPRSQRMTKGLLSKEIEKPKIAIREIELAMVTEEEDGGRRSKRRCRR